MSLDDFMDDVAPSIGISAEMGFKARPFLKWAGGKAKLLPHIIPLLPKKFKTYYEPFIGGGAVLFAVASAKSLEIRTCPVPYQINDWNDELTNLYLAVRDQPEPLMAELESITLGYEKDPKGVFAKIRAQNFDIQVTDDVCAVKRAARTIALNKTGFNGLYRQNKTGQFNVPWGKKPKVKMFDPDNIRACSAALQDANITTGDFAIAIEDAEAGDFVYMDPPYIPHSDTANFTNYTSAGFSMDDQQRVATTMRTLVDRGVHVVVSNNDVPIIYELYKGFDVHKIQAKRSINSKGDKRGPVGEVLIVG